MNQSHSIEEIRIQFEQWRLTRKNHRERIPTSLWESAALLAKEHSVDVVAKVLRLNHTDLKKRVQKYCGEYPVKTTAESDFIEITCEPPIFSQTECVVELSDPAG